MKVKDLLKKLEALDQESTVVVTSENFEQNGAKKQARGIFEFKGNIVKEQFRDAFDGDSYSSEVVKWDDNGKINFVQIT